VNAANPSERYDHEAALAYQKRQAGFEWLDRRWTARSIRKEAIRASRALDRATRDGPSRDQLIPTELVHRIVADRAGGFTAGGGDGRGSGHSDPTMTVGLTFSDPVWIAAMQFVEALSEATHQAQLAEAAAARIRALESRVAADLVVKRAPMPSGECANCGEIVLNTRSDRLRAGRCGACYEHRRRTGQDRPRPQAESGP